MGETSNKPGSDKPEGEAAVRAAVAEMPAQYRAMGERLHNIITGAAPGLAPRLWYGMPAYAKAGKVICFVRVDKYMTFGFTEDANLTREQGAAHQLIPSAYFLSALDEPSETRIAELVRKAAS